MAMYIPKQEAKFVVSGVRVRGQPATYELMEKLSPKMNFEELREYSESERKIGNPYLATAPEVFALMEEMSRRDEETSEEDFIRGLDFWKNTLQHWPSTASLCVYNPENQKDVVVHGFGDLDYSVKGNLIGPSGLVEDLSSREREALKLSFGTKDSRRINRVTDVMSNNLAYFWRINFASDERVERVVGFDANLDRFDLNCGRNLASQYPAFRVRKVE